MTTENLWQIFIYVFRCFDPNRKPAYIKYNDTDECRKLTNRDNPPYSFVIIRH
jgi:hypothetical protein